jgi:hypothetical protein
VFAVIDWEYESAADVLTVYVGDLHEQCYAVRYNGLTAVLVQQSTPEMDSYSDDLSCVPYATREQVEHWVLRKSGAEYELARKSAKFASTSY